MPHLRIENAKIDRYRAALREPHRPPSRGGNTSALHVHLLTIAGSTFSFLARGSRQWVYKSDLVSFEYEIKGNYRNVIRATLRAIDLRGCPVVRGDRRYKEKLRSTITRLPSSRREARD